MIKFNIKLGMFEKLPNIQIDIYRSLHYKTNSENKLLKGWIFSLCDKEIR